METKKLYRVEEGKVLLGVCGGIAKYFDIDPTVIRVLWAVLALSGTGILAYFIAAVIMPVEGEGK